MTTHIARDYRTGTPISVGVAGGLITTITPFDGPLDQLTSDWIAPALFDLQINGAMGHSFNAIDLTIEQVRIAVDVCRTHGIGGLLPTLITTSQAAFLHGFRTIMSAIDQDPTLDAHLPGFHLEGPYISPEDGAKGAHPREHIRPPNRDEFDRLQDAARGRIRLVTLAPEVPGAIPFIEHLASQGIIIAIGHTSATPAQIRDAITAGARLSTHLGNGSHAMLPRHENYLWEQLAADELIASIIPDGFHLPATMLKIFTRVKTVDRLIITCDASSLAGLPAGRYSMWGNEFEITPAGRVGIPGTPFLAGSGVFTDRCVERMIALTGVSLADAIRMASDHPRRLLGLPIPTLEVGQPAELMAFDWAMGEELRVRLR